MYLFFFSIFLALLPSQAADKKSDKTPKCNLTLIEAPTVEKLRLGMTIPELINILPAKDGDSLVNDLQRMEAKRSDGTIRRGDSQSLNVRYSGGVLNSRTSPKFGATLGIRDDVVYSVKIYYEESVWGGAEGMVEYLRRGTALPELANWEENGSGLSLRCDGFQIDVVVSDGPHRVGTLYMELREKAADKKLGGK